ncbi:MAG TPA: aldo/keto reductase [Solirubrobacteraceae bacterium]|nr:aldo/keto reductase [Solirubrobacteraceae bacterium]
MAASNLSGERLAESLETSEREGLAPYVALQPHYNLVERDHYEGELMSVCEAAGVACLPYFGLARGFLTGKYRRGGPHVDSPRAQAVRDAYLNDRGVAVLDALDAVAGETATSVASVALAWLRSQPTVLAPIASATSVDQLLDLLPAATLELGEAQLAALAVASGTPRRGA